MMVCSKRLIVLFVLCMVVQWAYAESIVDSPMSLRLKAINYEHGREGISRDYKQAFLLYCQAALNGDVESAYNMGFMYFNGRGVPRNIALAMRWFKQAAEGGDAHAQKMLERYGDILPLDDDSCKPAEPILTLIVDSNPNIEVVKNWVHQIAPYYGIDPDLVMAVIRAESAFNIKALSNKNAQGLMQLIPETAERFGVKDSWNPIQNIKGGTAYLHWLLRHFQGKVELVLAAYNAGEGAVERYQGIPPYQETQNYVRQILAYYPKPFHPVPPEQPGNIVILDQKI